MPRDKLAKERDLTTPIYLKKEEMMKSLNLPLITFSQKNLRAILNPPAHFIASLML